MIKRIRQLQSGWLRLLIVVYLILGIGLIAVAFGMGRGSGKYYIEFGHDFSPSADLLLWGGIYTLVFFWPLVRVVIWIQDGFKARKSN